MRLVRSHPPLRLTASLAWFALACAFLAAIPRANAADLEEVLAARLLRIGLIATEAPPLVQTNPDGTPGGFEADFITEVARRMDVKVTFVRTAHTPEDLLAQVVSSQVDVGLGQLTDSLEWAKSVRFSRPYLQLKELRLVDRLAATRAGGSGALLLDKTSRVASVAGSIVLPGVREEFGDRLTVFPSLQAAIDAVLTGTAVAVVADDIAASRWLKQNPAAGLRLEVVTRRDRRPGLAMAVNWKSDDLQAWLNLCIEKCALDGTLESLAAKHLGAGRP